jgi:hypothetical protein
MPEKVLRIGRCRVPLLLAMLMIAAPAGGAFPPDNARREAAFALSMGAGDARPAGTGKILTAQARPSVDPRKLEEWKSLPPEAQRDLRGRMDQWKRMPPEYRERYSERFRQWQNLPPEERQKIRNRLDELERLSPDEKEDIRKKFRKR